ncbi:MAG TPA: glycosyltransferase family 1 protein [Sediminibacterium sp.]|nr:glycosyltransferase family 1 protein [Sediminibacterium sp.]
MRIVVNAIFLQNDRLEGYGRYVHEIFSRMVAAHPEDAFLFLSDRPLDDRFRYASNCQVKTVPPRARHPLSMFWWYHVKAPLAMRKWRPDVWVQPYGFGSLFTRIPQVLLVHDLAFLYYPQFIPWYHRLYYRLFTPAFLKKAAKLVTVSEFSRNDICGKYGIAPEKIAIIPPAARAGFQPVDPEERENIKHAVSSGQEYFLYTGSIHPRKNLLNLLKAFSIFKKKQHSQMKLLIVGRQAWDYEGLLEKLQTYRYRKDVVLTGYVPEEKIVQFTAAAYALVYPSYWEGFALPILEAMQSGTPVLASQSSAMPETGQDAALYADPASPEAIAAQLLLLYKDENLRNRLVRAGFQRAAQFSWDDSASRFRELIASAQRQ